MPKKGRKRLTTRKGISISGKSTSRPLSTTPNTSIDGSTTPVTPISNPTVIDVPTMGCDPSSNVEFVPPPSKQMKVSHDALINATQGIVIAASPILRGDEQSTPSTVPTVAGGDANIISVDIHMGDIELDPSVQTKQLPRKYKNRWTHPDGTPISGCSTRTTRRGTRANTTNTSVPTTQVTVTEDVVRSDIVIVASPQFAINVELPNAGPSQAPVAYVSDSSCEVTAVPDMGFAAPSTPITKDKKRVSFYSIPVVEKPNYDSVQFVPVSHIQEAMLMLTYDGLPSVQTLDNLGISEDNKNLIISMLRFFPTEESDIQQQGPSKQDNSTIQGIESFDVVTNPQQPQSDTPVLAAVQVNVHDADLHIAGVHMPQEAILPVHPAGNDSLSGHILATPALDRPEQHNAVVEAPPQNWHVVDVEQAIIDAVYEVQREEQARVRAAIRQDWDDIAEYQRQVNHAHNPLHTYLMAMDRRPRRGEFHLGGLINVCSFCRALYFKEELNTRRHYTKCCREGKVRLPALQPMPHLLTTLFNGQHPFSGNFRRQILSYNYAFQFVSLEANLRQLPPGRAPPVYIIEGKVYHHISNVNVNEPVQRYGPIYFLNPQDAVEQRHRNNDGLNPDIIRDIEAVLRQINPYAQAYMHLRQRYDQELHIIERLRIEAEILGRPLPLQMPLVTLELLSVRGANNRQFDVPAVNEVAAVYNANPDHPPTPNLKVYVRDHPTTFRTIDSENEVVDPMVFPLLFPLGERGWHIRMLHHNINSHITLCEYYAYRLAIRDADQRFRFAGKLTQQYIVAAYIKIEANKLKFFRLNQDKLRAENYAGLADYLHRRIDEEEEGAALGRMVILPSTFIGGPRYQQQLFQDSMAVVARFGTPSLFITMTTNPRWREIVENIPQGTQANDHAMLLARVFQTKVDELMRDLLVSHAFGVPIANLYVIEFQKRGLPHVHILTILRHEDKLVDPQRVDMLISAEIPDPATEPDLYEIVSRNMVHGPCGAINPNSVCMVDGRCSKKYPMPFVAETSINDDGKMTYRRRNNGRSITVPVNGRQVDLDNRWIVPYNPYATLKYNCHINVEACATVGCVKYLYKYFFKGVDQALLRINVQHEIEYDEVESFLNGRYISPAEASWHINQFPLHKNSHAVIRLPVHLPQRQNVNFQPGAEDQALERNEITQLTDWFRLNVNDVEARGLLYMEVPLHYVWDKPNRRWKRRQQRGDQVVCRMYSVSIRSQELYYLRLLLLHVRGPQSFEDVRTVAGVVCDSFHEAYQLRGLLADDTEWVRALREAADRQMPHQLRNMLAYMLIFCEISDKRALFATFLDNFIEDHTRRDVERPGAIRLALIAIQHTLMVHGAQLSDFGLPEPLDMEVPRYDVIDIDAERLAGQAMTAQLNGGQLTVFESVMAAVNDDHFAADRLFLINSPAGCGKSFLFQTLINVLRGQQMPVLALTPTGLSASILKGGRTLHSRFKIPLDINETTTTGVRPLSTEGRTIAAAKLIIIDEISMATKTIFNLVERGLRDICNHNGPFANKTVLIAGDFRQTLPIVPHGNRCSIVDACVMGSVHFPLFQRYDLNVNVRARDDEQDNFSRWLLQLGDGSLPSLRRTFYGAIIKLPRQCILDNKQQLIDFCFSNLQVDRVPDSVILTPLNATCQDINDLILEKLPGQTKTYYSADSVDATDDPAAEMANYTVEFLNTLTPSGVPPHKLTLKVGCIVMILRNLNLRQGLCNGTRLLVRVLGNRYIDAEIIDMSGRLTGERVFIPRIDLSPAAHALPFRLKRRQFPVKLSYALTINKSQGQTFNKVGIYLPQPVLAHGQLYVAFSRARNFESVRISLEDTPIQGRINPADPQAVYTRNIVYREVL